MYISGSHITATGLMFLHLATYLKFVLPSLLEPQKVFIE
jgi:hypothetical protein